MQTVLALIVAVLIDWWARHLPGGQFILRCRSVNWFSTYVTKMMELINHYKITRNYLVALAIYLPMVAALFLIQILFTKLFGATGSLLFVTFSLVYFLGNTDAGMQDSDFVQAHETSFAILFWFALLGPMGALTYWFLAVCKQNSAVTQAANPEINPVLEWVHAIAAWIPARITGFLYALVGNFTKGFNCWVKAMSNTKLPSSDVLNDCGIASTDATIENDSENLVERAFVAWAVLSIIIVVIVK